MQDVEVNIRPRLIEQVLLTRREAARALKISEREWDRIRKKWHFTEIHVSDGHKGLRFLGVEVEDYIWKHANPSNWEEAS